ncbi:hypothetical protein ACFB49_04790 [Sphingomonas sp. DBB INV C78]|uniref:hypothetical protein n=1 Tax=Sphingomonas sp. DBB INV C78 TaxID=3349434 RepID=UPI0036D265F5
MTTNAVSIAPRRNFIQPLSGDSWESIATRELPATPTEDAVNLLKSWNLYVAFRPVGAITPTDIIFVEPPRAG